MPNLSNYAETEIRGWMSQGTDPDPAPSNIYIALHTEYPGDAGGSGEVSAGDYARESTTAGSDWDTVSNNEWTNANEINFGEASNDWGTITHATMWDAASGGNMLAWLELDTSKTVGSGDTPTFYAGDFTFHVQ